MQNNGQYYSSIVPLHFTDYEGHVTISKLLKHVVTWSSVAELLK